MKALVKPSGFVDVDRNHRVVLEHIRGLTAALRLEKPRPAGPHQMSFPFEWAARQLQTE